MSRRFPLIRYVSIGCCLLLSQTPHSLGQGKTRVGHNGLFAQIRPWRIHIPYLTPAQVHTIPAVPLCRQQICQQAVTTAQISELIRKRRPCSISVLVRIIGVRLFVTIPQLKDVRCNAHLLKYKLLRVGAFWPRLALGGFVELEVLEVTLETATVALIVFVCPF